jgi:hypothetical protein
MQAAGHFLRGRTASLARDLSDLAFGLCGIPATGKQPARRYSLLRLERGLRKETISAIQVS